jgi:hypothetical protein
MLNALRKPSEETLSLKEGVEISFVEIPSESEVPTQFAEVREAIEAREVPLETPKSGEVPHHHVNKENPIVLLRTLKQEENFLTVQKQQLVSNRERLRLRTIEEIEKTKARISGLRSEIPELKQDCQDMAKALKMLAQNNSN